MTGADGFADLPDGVADMLPGYLGAQRWFAGEAKPDPDRVGVEWARELWSDGADRRLWQAVVAAGDDHYQLVLGERPGGEPADFLHGHDEGVLGFAEASYFYDAAHDAELAGSCSKWPAPGPSGPGWLGP